jgi:DNA modification methylase
MKTNKSDQVITDRYALYNGDCVEVMKQLPNECVDLSVYSPPFAGLYQYSSDERDMSNCISRKEFFKHYEFGVREIHRLTKPGRMTAVHCMDIPTGNSGCDSLIDFPGEIIRLHEANGWKFTHRYFIWKEPLTIRNRTMMKSLAHRTLCEDSTRCSMANADMLLIFRRSGQNAVPVAHPTGLARYAGERQMPNDVLEYKGMEGDQKKNRFSHWIWRKYADAFWDDIRIDEVLPYRCATEADDEKHCHPLQLDVIERACVLWSNPGEVILTPFLGVGSEAYGALINGRKAIGIELKTAYYQQAVKNCAEAAKGNRITEQDLITECSQELPS